MGDITMADAPELEVNEFSIVSPDDDDGAVAVPILTVDEQGRVTGCAIVGRQFPEKVTVKANKFAVNGHEVTPEQFSAFLGLRALPNIPQIGLGRLQSADGKHFIDFDSMTCDPETAAGMAAQGSGTGAFSERLDREIETVREMLLAKNRAYGNSALDPVRVFSSASPVEQIKVRLDDKISRLVRGEAAGEDVENDLLGYLFLLRIARQLEAERGSDHGGE